MSSSRTAPPRGLRLWSLLLALLLFTPLSRANSEELPPESPPSSGEVVRSLIVPEAGSLTEAGMRYVEDRAASILAAKGIPSKLYELMVFPEIQELSVRGQTPEVASQVITVLEGVLRHYQSAVRTRAFTLQYGNSEEVATMLARILGNVAPTPQGGAVALGPHLAADTRANAVVATGTLSELNRIHETIQSLDRRTAQVLIRVLIAEVSLDRTTQFGIEWSFTDGTFLGNSQRIPTATQDFGTQGAGTQGTLEGLRYAILEKGRLSAFLQALRTRSQINVLSAPQLLTSNNVDAYFEETVKVPILQTATTATGVINTSVAYSDIGIKLEVKPQINRDEVITLAIRQTIQNILANPTVQNAPTFSNRVVRTNVLARDGHTVILGGLLKDNERDTLRKVPLLGDLPLIKDFFRRREMTSEKTELMVFITPQIVREGNSFEKVLEDLKAPRLKERLARVPPEYLDMPDPKHRSELLVLAVEDRTVILSAGKDSRIRADEELEVYRPGKEYVHPVTNQLIRLEEQKVARLQVVDVRDKTAHARAAFIEPGMRIRPGDQVRPPPGGFGFSSLDLEALEILWDMDPAGYRLHGIATVRNHTSSPILKTTTGEGEDAGNLRYFVADGDHWKPLRSVIRSGGDHKTVELYLGRFVKPGETIRIKLQFGMASPAAHLERVRKLAQDPESWAHFRANFGSRDVDADVTVEMRFPGPLRTRNTSKRPLIRSTPDGTTSLIWTGRGTPWRVQGEYQFQDPRAILAKLEADLGSSSESLR